MPHIAYCTNVHPGETIDELMKNLDRHAVEVKRICFPPPSATRLGIGLWLSAGPAHEMFESGGIAELRRFLDQRGLEVRTFNGFPYGNFHDRTVKYEVYEPDWRQKDRQVYTLALIDILRDLLPDGATGSISTVPLGWRSSFTDDSDYIRAADQLLETAEHLAAVEERDEILIHVDLEPEPGCALDTSDDVVHFFESFLLPRAGGLDIRRYLRVCHDICHAAVMFEDQSQALARYAEADIKVGKVQVSSALRVNFDRLEEDDRYFALAQLREFDEPRYLHQTIVRDSTGGTTFYNDLPRALEALGEDDPTGEWRVHFHIPIFHDRFDLISATQEDIIECLRILHQNRDVHHYEVETYAWNVLPSDMKKRTLAEDIAREIEWLRDRFNDLMNQAEVAT